MTSRTTFSKPSQTVAEIMASNSTHVLHTWRNLIRYRLHYFHSKEDIKGIKVIIVDVCTHESSSQRCMLEGFFQTAQVTHDMREKKLMYMRIHLFSLPFLSSVCADICEERRQENREGGCVCDDKGFAHTWCSHTCKSLSFHTRLLKY